MEGWMDGLMDGCEDGKAREKRSEGFLASRRGLHERMDVPILHSSPAVWFCHYGSWWMI